ncbi:Diacylglycerol O-acyltransferase 2 [Chelonia mydas]|uniref:Acyltransferase n=1 Tax=Chelonia mydas TaxID=8469 RepID=M7BQ21_CHEMY|nr:Diacylglycerol O-acyltransferase 2 [Chelonia mydas]
MGIVFLFLLIYLVFTSFWPVSALYLAWVIFDWDAPEQGGRRSAWVRNWPVWKHFRDYFPIQLVKTHSLLPSHNYIIGAHPHGILCVGAFCNFITESTGFSEKFPGIRPFLATLAGNFRLPVFREYLMSGGLCPVTRQAIGYLLSQNGSGNAVAVVIGGAAESLSCQPGITTLILKNRKGFVRMALQHGHNYIIGAHPHGILCVGAFCNFITESTGFSEKFPGIRPFLATLAGNFRLPVFREYLMSGGLCPVTRQAIGYLLSQNGSGNAVAVVIGGAAESLSCQPGITTLILKNRKGFVRMALQHGAHLVPAFSFGENDLFRQVVFEEGSWMRGIQKRFQKLVGFAPCVFYGRGLTSIHSRGFLPYPKPITTVSLSGLSKAHLVPAFSFGENDLFRQVVFEEGSWMRGIQKRFQKLVGFAPCVFYGRGLTSIHSRGFLPYPKPITTVIGEPVTVPRIKEPSHETVDLYHAMYIRSLLKLFNDHKAKYGLSEADELRIL